MPPDYSAWIAPESDAFADTILRENLDRRIPGCPEWTLLDLAGHLGRVQSWWAKVMRNGGELVPEDPDSPDRRDSPADATAMVAWFRGCTRELLDSIESVPPDAPAWTWWGEPRTAGAIARHQAQEAAVHRWDAQSAVGDPDPIPADLASDAVDEFLDNFTKLAPVDALRATVDVRATDTNASWSIGTGSNGATVSGTASDVLLTLYGRPDSGTIVVEGDRAAFDDLLAAAGTE